MNFVTRSILTLAFAFSAVVLGDAANAADDISKVNGSVKVEPGQQVGNVDTVNGSVTIGAGARAGKIDTVNGSTQDRGHGGRHRRGDRQRLDHRGCRCPGQ